MAGNAGALQRWLARLADLPQLALPTDYPRPAGERMVEAQEKRELDDRTASSLVRLAMFEQEEDETTADDDDDEEEADAENSQQAAHARPTPFHLLLSAFVVLLHRYTGDADIIVATSSPSSPSPLLLRIKLDPADSFWSVVKQVQFVEKEADSDKIPFEDIVQAFRARQEPVEGGPPPAPLFRVRFFDEMDETEHRFLQSTSLTSDMTILVTGSSSDSNGNGMASSASTLTPSLLRSSLLPAISLTLSYNSLLFSHARVTFTLDQLTHLLHHASLHPLDQIGNISLVTAKQRKVLPDPRADLEWTGYRGAITDIFSANAQRFPDRPCIVESVEDSAEQRVYSYSTIDRASNVLAHALVSGGVEREDVVTVYSTRNVDLVVAVMGILKAGATFSVIDPAYPPNRQTVYLQVARPRALVILARAGKLLPPVRAYVEKELDLRTEIPALQLHPSGTLLGSESAPGSTDALHAFQDRADKHLNIPLGPDSVATLSFTSGSTGIPKGVRGRHFSLTHFFPWMSERFGLTEGERFTMLSGIAHDPIQRDIFTPLFLGAQLRIPTAEDIGTPGRLAEWMADNEVTVTHLTPAMGQLLSAQATRPIPTLRNAFFVGDVLTKRDCTRLQQLANNVQIINMFGTTETQRAVSYFAIPSLSSQPAFLKSRKDIMPAGSGMINVQLLVVNRNDKNQLCGVGEVGEIYVRSGGLAEGYLQLPDATAEKFVLNWFGDGIERPDSIANSGQPWAPYWKGVRDRMYRTGDLGRYGPDGLVECTGRADDQVKIRGFRIELGEIDTHLSRHPAVRENVTLVRRDKYEEKVLVSYFVPLFGSKEVDDLVSSTAEDSPEPANDIAKGMQRHRKLIKAIRDHLKTKLPTYSVPSVFVPLTRMPLNPNGKIDKPALPFPDTATAAAAASSHSKSSERMTSTQQTIHTIWQRLLPSPPASIPLDESFFDLGGHSILATRLIFDIRKTLSVNAPLGIVFDYPTIRALADHLDSLRNSELGIAQGDKAVAASLSPELDYAEDEKALCKELPVSFPSAAPPTPGDTVFLTGATGYLGAYILHDLIAHRGFKKVICHVRAPSTPAALQRLADSGTGRGVWDKAWVTGGVIEVVTGDLDKPQLGMDAVTWRRVADEASVIIHNGAVVHWVYPYVRMRAANVLATVEALRLAATGRAKALTFISTTATIEKGEYVRMAESSKQRGGLGVPESDPLDLGRTGLTTGYGQSKWVAERLVMEAGRRGLAGGIVRPSYIVGDVESGVTNTDDFLWRLVKGCIQLGRVPDIFNTVNMVPVNHVARITTAVALSAKAGMPVHHVTARPLPRFNDFLGALNTYGWQLERVEYLVWREQLEQHVLETQDNALFPLLHFVLDDLPTSMKAAELDDTHTATLLRSLGDPDSITIDLKQMGVYLAWLIAAGFLDKPPTSGSANLPELTGEARAIGRSTGH